ncbi:ABC transporter ATP-binding protein [Ruminococcus sp.]|jgi:ABC-2 type transport system ATP-binding protein|uniref:ABC transporter ATP-binding protein n=1 Tax=Ruminococcus sp. TaxID=41978 RepID=UPI002B5783F0|nr:ABC transporter ATP-binding protein [Ruminococcus sp.]HNZ99549.1 ABC transporter ATP-binding protein [Ruminococcus sp.]HOH86335.1 ABC transporter ATP-binding protein [Ruminococcus sp.]
MNDYENAIEIKGLTKRYDGFTLDNVSFDVPKGSIMGFIGQNGAGKTTTINALLNIVKKDEGEIKLLGLDSVKDEFEVKSQIAAVFDELPFDDRLNANDINKILREVFEQWSSETFFGYLDRFSLPRKKKFGKFSKGMKMKLQIASALSHNAKLLIMDEATTGLDPVVRNEILDIFLEYLQNEEHTILMSSHITSDLDKVADSVTFIDKGKLLISGYKDDILDSHGVLKCTKNDYKEIDPEDIISARLSDFGAEVMVADRAECSRKYSGAVIDPATLEEIMIYYVNRSKKEWR